MGQRQLTHADSFGKVKVQVLVQQLQMLADGLRGPEWDRPHFSDVVYLVHDRFDLKCKVAEQLYAVLTPNASGLAPVSNYAGRVMRFFLGSLRNRSMKRPAPVVDMRSLTTLTPHLREPVVYPISLEAVAEQFSMPLSSCTGLDDLIGTRYNGASLMSYLRSTYPNEWDNFKERLKRQMGEDWPRHGDTAALSEIDFVAGAPLHSRRQDLMHWASTRGQLLLRTVIGMNCYQRAVRFHAQAFHHGPELEHLVRSKYNYIVSSQVFGEDRKSSLADGRWRAHCIEKLLEQFRGCLTVAYVDRRSNGEQSATYSVLISGDESQAGSTSPEGSPGHVEMYRIQLPQNDVVMRYVPNPGFVLGEGKPENQNHPVMFCFGEVLQSIDMNQDNNFAEALKLPNMLAEFDDHDEDIASGRSIDDIACVGFREWIFSEEAGAQGAFAASTEFAFGTIAQRIMSIPGGVRFHYGHPDLWNKTWVMTRGGVSKATKGLHISEDVFSGYNHVLRGGKVKFQEFMEAGKGRDNGFDGINGFAAKVAGGNGEQMISRDIYRLGTRMDFFRLLAFYTTGPGFYMNIFFVLLGVYSTVWAFLVLTVTGAQRLEDGENPGTFINTISGRNATISVVQVLQLGFLGFIMFLAESCLEHGCLRTVGTLLSHVISGSPMFFIFRSRTQAHYFIEDVLFGGAKYIATGRGFALQRSSFVKMYTMYARTHLYWGAELFLLLWLLYITGLRRYFANTFSPWIVTFCLLFSPLWFNPNAFSLSKVQEDFAVWQVWMKDGLDEDTNTTWYTWHREQLRRRSNSDHSQANVFLSATIGILSKLPSLVIAIFAFQFGIRPTPDCHVIISCNQWVDWSIFTGGILGLLLLFLACRALLGRWRRIWRVVAIFISVSALGLVIAYYAVYRSHSSWENRIFFMWVFVDFEVLVFLSQIVVQLEAILRNKLDLNLSFLRRLINTAYRTLDYIIGFCYFVVMFVLAFSRIATVLQAVLLFNVSFGLALVRGMLFQGFYIKDWVDHQIGQKRQLRQQAGVDSTTEQQRKDA